MQPYFWTVVYDILIEKSEPKLFNIKYIIEIQYKWWLFEINMYEMFPYESARQKKRTSSINYMSISVSFKTQCIAMQSNIQKAKFLHTNTAHYALCTICTIWFNAWLKQVWLCWLWNNVLYVDQSLSCTMLGWQDCFSGTTCPTWINHLDYFIGMCWFVY